MEHWLSLAGASRQRLALTGLIVLGFLCLTRIPFAPKYLFYFDSVNFALALKEFNPAAHQPQPPGYPLQVAFTRGLHQAIPKPEHVFLAAGLLTSLAAVLVLWRLGEEMFSARAGMAAAVLLSLNPAFWLSGLSNQVRLWLAAGAAATVLAVWRSLRGERPARDLWLACGLLGIFSGFRPAMLLFLFPLLAYAAIRARVSWRDRMVGGIALGLPVVSWLGVTVWASGGWGEYASLLRGYTAHEFGGSSAILGAPVHSAWRMVQAAVVWTGLGCLSWLWALAWVRPGWGRQGPVLALWLLPPFLFHALVHVGDPDHTLITVAGLCLLGGAALDRMARLYPPEAWWVVNGAALALNALLFFFPFSGLAGASTYRAVEFIDRQTRETVAAIRRLEEETPAVLVCHQCFVTQRHLGYYLPQYPLLVLPQRYDAAPAGAVRPVAFVNGRPAEPEWRDGAVELPRAERWIWLMSPHDESAVSTLAKVVDLRQSGPVYWSPVAAGETVHFGAYRLRAGR